jgi:hypothetical protein
MLAIRQFQLIICVVMYIQLLRGEWTSAHSRGIRLHNSDHMTDHLRWNPEPGADASDCG